MDPSASTRSKRSSGTPSVVGLTKLLARLTPRQFSDEFSLAREQMKQKGITAGIGAAFLAVALVFLAFLVVALIVAAIMGLATVMDAWLAALAVGGLFLLIMAIMALIGVSRVKRAMPLMPVDAIRGVRYDIGVLREGRSFDPATLDIKQPKEEKPAKSKDTAGDGEPKEPSYEELRSRSRRRREHLAEVRDGLGRSFDVKARWRRISGGARAGAAHATQSVKSRAAARAPVRSTRGTGSPSRPVRHNIGLLERWKPLSVAAASSAAMAVMVRRLLSK